LKEAILKIKPNRIQLNTLDRPERAENLLPASIEKLNQIIEFWQLERVEIIAKAPERKNLAAYHKDVESAILGTVARRPCTADDLTQILGTHVNEISKYLETLESEHKIRQIKKQRGVLYQQF
jgi:wyosine [tRNA(Phe)-imidazoG37] synthetase (radical SAM superfamily)